MSKHPTQLGEPTQSERNGAYSRDLNLRRERRQELEGTKYVKTATKKRVFARKQRVARKRRVRGKAGRCVARRQSSNNRDQARRKELIIATHNVRTMAVDGKHDLGQAAEVLGLNRGMGSHIVGLQENKHTSQSALLQAGYVVHCSGESRGDGEVKKGQSGVGLAFRTIISRAVKVRPTRFFSVSLLKVTREFCGRSLVVIFVVEYAPTDAQAVGEKGDLRIALEKLVKKVPKHGLLFVLMNANARTSRTGGGGGLLLTNGKFSVLTAEIFSTIMVCESFIFFQP